MAMQRRNLVIVRAGNTSLHPNWLTQAQHRNWDLIVSYFGDDPEIFRQGDVKRIDSKGPKWPALCDLINEYRDQIEQYDYVWLPDDDIACSCSDINKLFEIARSQELELCQPALSLNSYFSWGVTLKVLFSRVRLTNFVEIMVPCFSRASLFRCLPSMGTNLSGFGLDFLWPKLLGDAPNRIGIVDAVAVTHTRPIGGPNHSLVSQQGTSPDQEGREVRARHDIDDVTIHIRRIKVAGGFSIDGQSRTARTILGLNYRFAIARGYVMRKPNRWDIDQALRPRLVAPYRFERQWP